MSEPAEGIDRVGGGQRNCFHIFIIFSYFKEHKWFFTWEWTPFASVWHQRCTVETVRKCAFVVFCDGASLCVCAFAHVWRKSIVTSMSKVYVYCTCRITLVEADWLFCSRSALNKQQITKPSQKALGGIQAATDWHNKNPERGLNDPSYSLAVYISRCIPSPPPPPHHWTRLLWMHLLAITALCNLLAIFSTHVPLHFAHALTYP